jgi:hypothetical protein
MNKKRFLFIVPILLAMVFVGFSCKDKDAQTEPTNPLQACTDVQGGTITKIKNLETQMYFAQAWVEGTDRPHNFFRPENGIMFVPKSGMAEYFDAEVKKLTTICNIPDYVLEWQLSEEIHGSFDYVFYGVIDVVISGEIHSFSENGVETRILVLTSLTKK